jgi:hypothetical protein
MESIQPTSPGLLAVTESNVTHLKRNERTASDNVALQPDTTKQNIAHLFVLFLLEAAFQSSHYIFYGKEIHFRGYIYIYIISKLSNSLKLISEFLDFVHRLKF